MLSIFDIVLIVIVAGFVFYGLFLGLIKMVGNLVGLVIGAWAASHFYLQLFGWLSQFIHGWDNTMKVVSFFIIFGLVSRLVVIAFSFVEKIFNILSIIPFLKLINRLAGAILGCLEGLLTVGIILFMISRYSVVSSLLGSWLVDSQITPYLLRFVNILSPFFPEALRLLKSIV
ncbi:MAG: CvpA family protein [Planctomycetes bacterium]|jgi:membrane protein required for colicin V production|nr:CvpA family protein [Planctomycetota bacterium]